MPPKKLPPKLPSSKVEELLNSNKNLLEKNNFKIILDESNTSQISCNQLSRILKRVHDEFIYHLNQSKQLNKNSINLQQLSFNEQRVESSSTSEDDKQLIIQLRYQIEALENQKSLYDNLVLSNKSTVERLEQVLKERNEIHENEIRKLLKRDEFYNYVITSLKTITNLSNVNTDVYIDDTDIQMDLSDREKTKIKTIDALILHLVAELKKKNLNSNLRRQN